MRINFKITMLLIVLTEAAGTVAFAQQMELPRPRPLPPLTSKGEGLPSVEFERVLNELKAEREALDAEWKAAVKRRAAVIASGQMDDQSLAEQLRDALRRAKEHGPSGYPLTYPPGKQVESHESSKNGAPHDPEHKSDKPAAQAKSAAGAADPLQLGQTLLRLGRHADALASLERVDVKSLKAEDRASVHYLRATCHLNLDDYKKAVECLLEAANTRGDERVADYAQWELGQVRWQQEVAEKLQEFRKRRLATEKRP